MSGPYFIEKVTVFEGDDPLLTWENIHGNPTGDKDDLRGMLEGFYILAKSLSIYPDKILGIKAIGYTFEGLSISVCEYESGVTDVGVRVCNKYTIQDSKFVRTDRWVYKWSRQ